MKLKSCPFCGGSPATSKTNSSDERNGYNFYAVVSCVCGISLRKPSRQDKNGWCNDTGQAVEDATEAWNRRATAEIENEAYERAAKVCDTTWNGDSDTILEADACNECAAAIRALKK